MSWNERVPREGNMMAEGRLRLETADDGTQVGEIVVVVSLRWKDTPRALSYAPKSH